MLSVIIVVALLAAAFGAGYWYGKRRAIATGTLPGATSVNMGSGASTISGGGA